MTDRKVLEVLYQQILSVERAGAKISLPTQKAELYKSALEGLRYTVRAAMAGPVMTTNHAKPTHAAPKGKAKTAAKAGEGS
jgi:hypothetical protein